MPQATAAVISKPNGPFRIEQIVLDSPRPNEVLVRMVATGLCHTDLIVYAGGLPFPMPGVLGHEGAGIVEAVGDAVTSVRPGDPVLLSFTSCGGCVHCRSGRPALCEAWLPMNLLAGTRADGSTPIHGVDGSDLGGHFFGQSSFASLAVADERSVVPIRSDTPLAVLAPLGCGVQTGAGTVFNVLKPGAGASIAVVGAGAVGLSAVMAAALTPATTIIAIDRVAGRLDLATELGATDTVDVTRVEVGEALRELTSGRGIDLALDTTGDIDTITATVSSLAVGGTLAFVGAPPFGATTPVDVQFMLPGRSVVGITEGACDPGALIPALIRLHEQGRFPIDRLVSTYPFQDIQRAVDDVSAGRAIKPVLTFEDH